MTGLGEVRDERSILEPLTRLPRFFQNALDTLSLKERDDELFLLPKGEGGRRPDEGFRFIRILPD